MISRILSIVILVPLAILLVVFCVSNRELVTVSLDPLGTMPQFTFGLPLFLLLMGAVILGVVMGGIGTWLTQSHYRRKAARRKAEMARLRREADEANERLRLIREEVSTSTALAAPRAA
jgi:uncharacterized integral membrane protein